MAFRVVSAAPTLEPEEEIRHPGQLGELPPRDPPRDPDYQQRLPTRDRAGAAPRSGYPVDRFPGSPVLDEQLSVLPPIRGIVPPMGSTPEARARSEIDLRRTLLESMPQAARERLPGWKRFRPGDPDPIDEGRR